jgi:hypothetical protein
VPEMLGNQKQAVAFQLYVLDRCAQLLQELSLEGLAQGCCSSLPSECRP